MPGNSVWWGEFALPLQQKVSWSIGERHIVVERLQHEWQTWDLYAHETNNPDPIRKADWPAQSELDAKLLQRHLYNKTPQSIQIVPALADRSIVARPASALRLMPGQSARIYISTPLWFQLHTLPKRQCILDIPFLRPSDSWFGPSTVEGELCYSKHTDARIDINLLEKRTNRAITPINIRNGGNDPLVFERINLPVPLLSLFVDSAGMLWTEAVSIVRSDVDTATELNIEKAAPIEAKNPNKLAEARVNSSKNRLIRSLSSLFA